MAKRLITVSVEFADQYIGREIEFLFYPGWEEPERKYGYLHGVSDVREGAGNAPAMAGRQLDSRKHRQADHWLPHAFREQGQPSWRRWPGCLVCYFACANSHD